MLTKLLSQTKTGLIFLSSLLKGLALHGILTPLKLNLTIQSLRCHWLWAMLIPSWLISAEICGLISHLVISLRRTWLVKLDLLLCLIKLILLILRMQRVTLVCQLLSSPILPKSSPSHASKETLVTLPYSETWVSLSAIACKLWLPSRELLVASRLTLKS